MDRTPLKFGQPDPVALGVSQAQGIPELLDSMSTPTQGERANQYPVAKPSGTNLPPTSMAQAPNPQGKQFPQKLPEPTPL